MDSDILDQVGAQGKPVVICEVMANMFVNIPSKESNIKSEAPPVHVGASPKEENGISYKRAFMAMLKEKVMNDVQSWNAIADKMQSDGLFEDDPHVSWDEVIAFISTMEGQVVPPSSN